MIDGHCRGYQGLTGVERNNLELLVAFGGSGKEHLERRQICGCGLPVSQDSADGNIGNAAW